MKIQVPMSSESAVPARKPYAVGAKPMARTAPKHPQTAARELQVDAAKPKKTKIDLGKPPKAETEDDLDALPTLDALRGKIAVGKFKDAKLMGKFRGMDICTWFYDDSMSAMRFVVGRFLPIVDGADGGYWHGSDKNELPKLTAKLAEWAGKGETVSIMQGKGHVAVYTTVKLA